MTTTKHIPPSAEKPVQQQLNELRKEMAEQQKEMAKLKKTVDSLREWRMRVPL